MYQYKVLVLRMLVARLSFIASSSATSYKSIASHRIQLILKKHLLLPGTTPQVKLGVVHGTVHTRVPRPLLVLVQPPLASSYQYVCRAADRPISQAQRENVPTRGCRKNFFAQKSSTALARVLLEVQINEQKINNIRVMFFPNTRIPLASWSTLPIWIGGRILSQGLTRV